MTRVNNFHELIVWQKTHKLALHIYQITKTFPRDEQFGLTSQIRRSSVSVSSNIAEGFERKSSKDFCHFLVIARGSVSEVQAQLMLAKDLEYIDSKEFSQIYELSIEVHKMINGLIKSLQTSKQDN